MRRLRTSLTTGWEFAPDLDGLAVLAGGEPIPPVGGWRPVRVPGYWQVQFRDLARATGAGWYRLELELDDDCLGYESLTLEFGAVSHFCQGWLNGHYLGSHEGGHLPFGWPIDASARAGTNDLLVRVVSPSGDRSRFPDFPFEETLHGKQSWYGSNGGIWQEVVLEGRSARAVTDLVIRPDADAGTVTVSADVTGTIDDDRDGELQIEFTVLAPNGGVVAKEVSTPSAPVAVPVPGDVERWSPDSPALYRVRATAVVGGRAVDHVEQRFGFRTFVAERGRFVLNGRPVTMRGVLDQDYWDDPGVPVDRQDLVDRFALVKAMGFNTLRCHVKVPDPRYLDVADELGLLVWCELPTTSRLTHRACERIEETLTAMIARDRHHPCLVVWGVANEAWGYDLLGSAEQRTWLNELYHRAKTDAPDRLIVDNSPCLPNFHIESDIEDFHFYAVIPEMRQRWTEFLDAFAGRAEFTYSPHGDAVRSGAEPLVVSEFGAWGLPDLTDLAQREGGEPWWFESGQEWAGGAAYVHGAPERFALWHLDAVFGTWAGLCSETQRRQFETMRFQIETMRARPEIAGYVLTELSDVHWEANGLLDMTGRPRSFRDRVADLNRAPIVIGEVRHPTMWDGDSVHVEVTAVNDGIDRPETSIRCGLAGSDEVASSETTPLDAFGHRRSVPFDVTVTTEGRPRLVDIECTLVSDGAVAATTDQRVLVVPRIGPQLPSDRPVIVADEALAARLTALGYNVTDQGVGLRVMRRLSARDHDLIEAGGKGLLLVDDTDAFGDGFGEYPRIELRAWREALYGGGEWVSAFSWLRRAGRFADLPGGPMMDSIFEGLAPDVVITGIPPAGYGYNVLAGVFVGWVHQVAALIARHHFGLGSLLISTLKLTEQPPGADPLADWLVHQLVATAWEQQ